MTVTTAALPDPAAIQAACEQATAHNHGQAVLGPPAISARGVRVRLSSWPRRQEARTALRALGYAVTEDTAPVGTEHGEALLVTGWDERLLGERAARLERAVHHLEDEHDEAATQALAAFRRYTGEIGLDEQPAQRRALDDLGRAITARPGSAYRHRSAAVGEHDVRQASGPRRDLLVRVAAGEAALAKLRREHLATAEAAIGLFLEYRDCHGYDDEDRAAAQALIDTREGVQAIHELAGYDNDPDWRA